MISLSLLILAAAGSPPPADFRTFHAELRAALERGDPTALAPLVSFPVRVNRPDGSATSIDNLRGLQRELDHILPASARRRILDRGDDGIIRRASGIGLGDGTIWVDLVGTGEAERYRIIAVNVLEPAPEMEAPQLVFVCDARAHRVVIDSSSGVLRYRAWNRPRALVETPDLEIVGGTSATEGTTPCTSTTWVFERQGTTYTVAELACRDAGEDNRAVGELTVSAKERPLASWWCY